MKLVYFAWVREQVGVSEEEIETPAEVNTVDDLLAWLATRGDGYDLFENRDQLRVAINQEHVDHSEALNGAREVAIFPPMTGG